MNTIWRQRHPDSRPKWDCNPKVTEVAESFLLRAKARFHMSAPPGESPCSLCLARPSGQLWENSTFWSGRIRRTPILFLSYLHSYLILYLCWQQLVVLLISDYLAKKRNLWIAVFSSSTPLQWTTIAVVMSPLWRLCFEGRLAEVRTEHTSLKHPLWTSYLFSTS